MMTLNSFCAQLLREIRKTRPLVHHLTNIVVANDNANTMLSLGALPVMAYAREEVEEMVSQAGALVVNLGTLTKELVESALLAGRRANALGVPVILDPVGAGATYFRKESALLFLREVKVAVLRGNVAEVRSLLGLSSRMRGVESGDNSWDHLSVAREAAQQFALVVAVTGAIDYVSDGSRAIAVHNGHALLTRVTGTGCMATSLCGAFAALKRDFLFSTAGALGFLGVCAEKSALHAHGPGSFRVALFDAMYNLQEEEFEKSLRLEVLEG
jgi:hydroxyethylthiazole kinase